MDQKIFEWNKNITEYSFYALCLVRTVGILLLTLTYHSPNYSTYCQNQNTTLLDALHNLEAIASSYPETVSNENLPSSIS